MKELNEKEIREIYREHMIYDFPKSELKPLERILSIEDYKGAGFYSGGELMGYCFYCGCSGKRVFLDYFAVTRGNRSRGLGGVHLKELMEAISPRSLILEVEDPDFGTDEADEALRKGRIEFYKRQGLKLSGVRARVFSDNYLIFAGGSPEEAARDLTDVYSRIFGKENIENGKIRVSLE